MNEEIAEKIGMFLENKIREKILSNVPPPNAESTIKRKGSSHTLIDDGILLASITHIVEIENDNTINITTGVLDPDIVDRAAPNEYGVSWETRPTKGKESKTEKKEWFIPPRSFIRSTFDEQYETLLLDIQQQIFNHVKEKLSGK